jgi:hypothetical protein
MRRRSSPGGAGVPIAGCFLEGARSFGQSSERPDSNGFALNRQAGVAERAAAHSDAGNLPRGRCYLYAGRLRIPNWRHGRQSQGPQIGLR